MSVPTAALPPLGILVPYTRHVTKQRTSGYCAACRLTLAAPTQGKNGHFGRLCVGNVRLMKVHHDCLFVLGRNLNDRGHSKRGFDCKNEHRPIIFVRKPSAIQKGTSRPLNPLPAVSQGWATLGCTVVVDTMQNNAAIAEVKMDRGVKLWFPCVDACAVLIGRGCLDGLAPSAARNRSGIVGPYLLEFVHFTVHLALFSSAGQRLQVPRYYLGFAGGSCLTSCAAAAARSRCWELEGPALWPWPLTRIPTTQWQSSLYKPSLRCASPL